jgi:hypothetical protein
MKLTRGSAIALTFAAAVAVVALFVATAQGAKASSTLNVVIKSAGHEYLTAAGSSSVFPGRLQTGDRVLGRDTVMQGARTVGYDNELCTVTFDDNDLCQTILVLPGQGQIEVSWLWVDRNASLLGPAQFSGLIDGGTGTFANAKGQFRASVLPNGTLKIAARLT